MATSKNGCEDWSRAIADQLGLAWCLEDVQLHKDVAPWYPLRRFYLRLCHDPGVLFMPPDFIGIIFCYMIIYGLSTWELPLLQFPLYLIMSVLVAMIGGLMLNFFLLPLVIVFGLAGEFVFAGLDIVLLHPVIWWRQKME